MFFFSYRLFFAMLQPHMDPSQRIVLAKSVLPLFQAVAVVPFQAFAWMTSCPSALFLFFKGPVFLFPP